MLRVFDHQFRRDKVILNAGEHFVTEENCVLCTVLGSCVAVCLRDKVKGISGMNHFMLPEPFAEMNLFSSDAGRYGIYALELLINALLSKGVSRDTLTAKIFGGGQLLATSDDSAKMPESNIAFANKFLETEKIPVLASDTGGRLGRKILFFPSNGDVFVKKLRSSIARKVVETEQVYQRNLSSNLPFGEVTLFDAPIKRSYE
jgi:chemotaxis protein CheD